MPPLRLAQTTSHRFLSTRSFFTSTPLRKIDAFFDSGRSADGQISEVGRAWRTAELRQKSFEDLHHLWHVLLREKNVLETERVHLRNPQLGQRAHIDRPDRIAKVRLSMARLQTVIAERSRVHKHLCQVRDEWMRARGLLPTTKED
jgi:large subunit ribosomal protein L47